MWGSQDVMLQTSYSIRSSKSLNTPHQNSQSSSSPTTRSKRGVTAWIIWSTKGNPYRVTRKDAQMAWGAVESPSAQTTWSFRSCGYQVTRGVKWGKGLSTLQSCLMWAGPNPSFPPSNRIRIILKRWYSRKWIRSTTNNTSKDNWDNWHIHQK